MKKRILSMLLVFVLIISTIPVYAENSIKVLVNGKLVDFDTQPVIENGRTLVPMRAIFEALGAVVSWDGTTRTATGVKGSKSVVIKIDSKDATVNGEHKTLDVPAAIKQGRTLVPLRFISESLGSKVDWDSSTKTANINDDIVAGLKISFIDVGQADSILVETPNGKIMLIDAGNNDDGESVFSYIKDEGLNKIDVLIGTHPHEDHIGGMDTIINRLSVGRIYMPKVTTNTKTFEDVLIAAKNKGLNIDTAKVGIKIDLDPDINIMMLAPSGDTYGDLNNYSAVIKMTYKNNSFLFEGDAQDLSESEMLAAGYNLKADVLKVAHHGSCTSTTTDFLKAVSPKYAVISVGKGNDYGHPSTETLNRLSAANVQIYRTDELGTITVTSNGNTIEFNKTSSSPKPEATQLPITTLPSSQNENVIITDVQLDEEIATITNKSTVSVDLTGWKLVSVKGNQVYEFPNGFTIQHGASIKITSGPSSYSNGTSVLKWTSSNIWNNDGDPAQLFNSSGNLVSSK